MLYVTTRNDTDAYTAQRVLRDRRGPDGGLFVPFRLPRLSDEEVIALGGKHFNQAASEILNLLFGTRLTAYDLDFAVGRHSIRLDVLSQRILMAECWHNPNWTFSRITDDLTKLVSLTGEEPENGDWPEVGVRMAVLFGIFSGLIRTGIAGNGRTVDVAMVAGDFSAPMAAWYARKMGLPIGNIVCCCNENGNLWDFFCHGHLRTDGVAKVTPVPEGDLVVPPGLERLIAACGGPEESGRFVEKLHSGGTYYADDHLLRMLRQGFYATVSSSGRIRDTIPSVYATHNYLCGPAAALAYAGLQDYRARTGESRPALVMTARSPRLDAPAVAEALGITEQAVLGLL